MKKITKEKANKLGLKRYFTGISCSSGHISERTVSRGDCVDCLYLRQHRWNKENADNINEKSRQWYLCNPEKAKATRADWREKNAEKDRANIAAYQLAHKEELKAAQAIWHKNNPEKIATTLSKSRKKNKARNLVLGSAWRKRNKAKVNAKKARRLASERKAMPLWATKKAIDQIYTESARRTAETGIEHHVDHTVPLRSKIVCGLHCEANLQILPRLENIKKSNRYWPDMP